MPTLFINCFLYQQGISVIELLSTSIGNEISEVLNSVFDYDFFEF